MNCIHRGRTHVSSIDLRRASLSMFSFNSSIGRRFGFAGIGRPLRPRSGACCCCCCRRCRCCCSSGRISLTKYPKPMLRPSGRENRQVTKTMRKLWVIRSICSFSIRNRGSRRSGGRKSCARNCPSDTSQSVGMARMTKQMTKKVDTRRSALCIR